MAAALAYRKKVAAPGEDVSQASLARAVGVKQPSVNAWFSGDTKSLKAEVLVRAADYLRVRPTWLSGVGGPMEISEHVIVGSGGVSVGGMANTEFSSTPSIQVPQMAAVGSMGAGLDRPSEDVITGTLTVSAEWAARELHIPSSRVGMLRFITGYGESMRPTFASGDVLLVDTAAVSVDVDGIYVLSADNQLFIKRVTRGLDGKFEVTSDNPVVRKVQQLDGEHEIQVLGRVVWVWNGKKV